ncbi:MAG TPA: RhuM family protein [Agriterribacter sp.]|nr:RhuM family protein [Agriterribacter sp.]
MKDWAARLHDILTINQKEIKLDAGRISKKIADELAEKEYEKFDAQRKEIEAAENLKRLEDGIRKLDTFRK